MFDKCRSYCTLCIHMHVKKGRKKAKKGDQLMTDVIDYAVVCDFRKYV